MSSNHITNNDFNGDISQLIDTVRTCKGDIREFIAMINPKEKDWHKNTNDVQPPQKQPTNSDILGIGIDY